MSTGQSRTLSALQCPLLELGFRPLYLLAGGFAAASIFLWVAQIAGWLGPHPYLPSPLWHAHEMVFGYTFVVIVGFLFTAVRNWTGEPTPSGGSLALIAAFWIAARFLVATPFTAAAAVADTLFALGAAAGIAVPLLKSANRRNYFFIALLLALGAANLAFYSGMAGVIAVPLQRDLQLGLDLILFIIAVMTGRVIPMFTNSAIPGAGATRVTWVERIALAGILAIAVADAAALPAVVVAGIAAITAAAHAARLALWKPQRTAGHPILWILHLSYAWIAVHLALRAAAALDFVPFTLATHALTVGAIGGLTMGMMTRTARGHTGRPLKASAAETACYVLVHLAAATRVFLPLVSPGLAFEAIVVSGALWAAAFALFVVKFWPILSRPRALPA